MFGHSQESPAIRGKGGPGSGARNQGRGQQAKPQYLPRQQETHPHPQLRHFSYAGAVGSVADNAEREAYKTLAKESKDKRNLLTLKTPKLPSDSGPKAGNRQLLEQGEWAELIFDLCEIKVEDVLGIDFQAGGYNAAEIQLKDEVDAGQYEGISKEFKGMTFDMSKSQADSTKVTFKSVPLSVPNQELIHLVKAYGGKMENEEVKYEKVLVSTPKGHNTEVNGTTRYVHATFPPNRRLRTFYWMQGPLPKDPMRRIIAEHAGQAGRQCGHCLRGSADPVNPCKFNGKTSACKKNNEKERTTLSQYFTLLRNEDRYVSLKNQYMWSKDDEELVRQSFPDEYEDSTVADGEQEQNQVASNWAEEMNEMRDRMKEKECLLKKEKEETRKARNKLKKANRESANMRKEISLNRHCIYNRVAETIGDKEEFEKNLNCTSSILANCLQLKDFEIKDGKVVTGKDSDPWKELKEAVNSKAHLLPAGEGDKWIKELVNATEVKLLLKLKEKLQVVPRSRSHSRSRSEEGEEEDGQNAKNAKLEDKDDDAKKVKEAAGPKQGPPEL